MIRIDIKKKKDNFITITLKGHAMYDDYGKDIVCAGVSSILITSVNGILKFDKNALNVNQKKDEVELKILKNDLITKNLLNNMIELFYELKENYPENITIREDEKNE